MNTIKIKYSPSVNIIRDSQYDFKYIVTPNSKIIFNHIFNDVLTGVKAHTIIGAFGIGKSSFLLSLQQTLSKRKNHFPEFNKLLKQLPNYDFVPMVGEFSSFLQHVAQQFGVPEKNYSSKDVLNVIENKYLQLKKKGNGLAIIIDEFGKFLEYASKHNPEGELYFIQQLSELVNDSKNDMLLITSLHQGFNAYAVDLNTNQQQEWDKVKGRLKDVIFNEPVEQILYLASERIRERFPNQKPGSDFNKLFACIQKSKAFPLRDYLEIDIAKKLLPFDILSASIIALSLQKYGQNERSLFSFIESNEYLGVHDAQQNGYYSLPQVYDYLINNFYSIINNSKNNSHFRPIRESVEKIEGVLKEEMLNEAAAIVKTIGLLNLFSSASGQLDLNFYSTYCKVALGIRTPEKIFQELEKFKIIRYTKHNFRYSLLSGTDVDIELAIDEAGRMVEKATNIVHHLNQHFDFPFIPAKAISYETGTPRFFQFKLSEEPIQQVPEGDVDGFINLVFAETPKTLKNIEEVSSNCKEAIIYGYFKNTSEIKKLLYEIQKIRVAITTHANDKAAIREFGGVEAHYKRLLNHYVLDSMYSKDGNVIWYYQGKIIDVSGKQSFNKTLSSICKQVYEDTPTFRNELINKTNISGQIAFARKKLLERLLSNSGEENIGFNENEFPPEKSIYLSLIKGTGIHNNLEGTWQLDKPANEKFAALWETSNEFLNSTKPKEKSLQDFIDILSIKPFKLKKGFIDYWIPLFLLIKNHEYALYENETYVTELSSDVFELMNKKPRLFYIKAFDVSGVRLQLFNRYRILLNQAENHRPSNKDFIQTIKPFLVFYKQLPEYSKKTSRLAKQTLALRQIIASAKDPEKTFFDDFPTAFGYGLNELQSNPKLTENFISRLQESIRELRTAYDELVNRFEHYFIKEIIGTDTIFPDYRNRIKERFKSLKSHLLLTHQKPFYNRLHSELDDRKAWLSSIAQACINKPLINLNDEDELVLFERINDIVYELDNLCELSESSIDDENEELVKIEITSLVQGLNKSLLRVSKSKMLEVDRKSKQIKNMLSGDKKINITILTKLLQELLYNE